MLHHSTSLKHYAKKLTSSIAPQSNVLPLIEDKLILAEQIRITKAKLTKVTEKLTAAKDEDMQALRDEVNAIMREFNEVNAMIQDHLSLLKIPEFS